MRWTAGSATGSTICLVCLMLLVAVPTLAQQGDGAETEPDPVLTGPGRGLGDYAAPDTVRSNLWLVEALMGEIATEGARALPDPPTSVRLEALSDSEANALFRVVAANVLGEQGYEVIVSPTDPDAPAPSADHVLRYDVLSVDLVYPEVGRTLGIWKRWVSRSVEISCTVEVAEDGTGRLLMSERLTRGFHDRLDQDLFDDVDSDVYDFTTAESSESGWKRRTEELVVLGTLAGLIAVYFANTGN